MMPWRDLFPWLPPITGDLLAREETVHFLAEVICVWRGVGCVGGYCLQSQHDARKYILNLSL